MCQIEYANKQDKNLQLWNLLITLLLPSLRYKRVIEV